MLSSYALNDQNSRELTPAVRMVVFGGVHDGRVADNAAAS
jgi:hypothetical protein